MISLKEKENIISRLGIGNGSDLEFLFNKYGNGGIPKVKETKKTPFQALVEDIRKQLRHSSCYKKVFEETVDFQTRWTIVDEFIKAELPPNNHEIYPRDELREKVEASKKEGNGHFGRKKFKEAIKSYTVSLRVSAESPEENKDLMALILGNRSAAFYQLGDYKASLQDIEGALYFGYPSELQTKLDNRKSRCRYLLSEPLSDIRTEIDVSSNHKILLKDFNDFVESNPKTPLKKKHSSSGLEHLLDFPHHERVPQLASYVDIVYNKIQGRHGIALQDINPGQPILYERPCVFHLDPIFSAEHCYDCGASLRQSLSLLGVYPHLSDVKSEFCSWPCFHHWTQTSYPYEKKYNINALFRGALSEDFQSPGIFNLTYETLVRHSYEYFRGNKGEFEKVDPRFGCDSGRKKQVYLWNDVSALYDVEGHQNTRKDGEESLNLLIYTWILLQYLDRVDYYPSKDPKDKLWMAQLVHHFLSGFNHNLHSVDRVKGALNRVQARGPISFESIGSGMFLTLLLLNHSCASNTINVNLEGSHVLVLAKTFIPKGSEVNQCYGPHYLTSPKAERTSYLLTRYKFSCACVACEGGDEIFPLLKNLPKNHRGQKEEAWEHYTREFRDGSPSSFMAIQEYLASFSSLQERVPDCNHEKAAVGLSVYLWTCVNGNQ